MRKKRKRSDSCDSWINVSYQQLPALKLLLLGFADQKVVIVGIKKVPVKMFFLDLYNKNGFRKGRGEKT